MNAKFKNAFYYFNLPGIVMHEIAHAIIILLLPHVKVTKLNLTSHVEYEGYYLFTRRESRRKRRA